MANIFSQTTSPAFSKQSVKEFFVDPMFMGEDIRGALTVRTDVKGTERLNMISRPSKITVPKTSAGFTAAGSFALTYKDITVKPMAIEFEQNGRAFLDSIVQQLLAQGYKEDDVEQMKAPDVWNKIMLPVLAQAGQQDLIRQMWFNNTLAETFSSSAHTGVADVNYNGYTGLLTHLYDALVAGTIPSAQHVVIGTSTSGTAAKQVKTLTYARHTDDVTLTITVNGVAYSQAYATGQNETIAAWLAAHKATVEARGGMNGVVVTAATNVLTFTARHKGGQFTATGEVTEGGGTKGTVTAGGAVAAVNYGALSANEADTTLTAMLNAAKPELLEFPKVFMITHSLWRNLVATFKARATELGDMVLQNGAKVPTYEGIPILIRPDWDIWIADANASVFPHRAVLTTPKNFIFATDGTSDSEMIETWYNQEAQMRRYRIQYKAQTAFLHPELVVLAGFGD
jgi:hypothetical protein